MTKRESFAAAQAVNEARMRVALLVKRNLVSRLFSERLDAELYELEWEYYHAAENPQAAKRRKK